jgi:pSer/pThr/pTyr-binding forkhead associated (FHA) protein/uncharacterized protein YbaR (Trm112 family)
MSQSYLILKLDATEERVYPLENRLTVGRKSSNAICLSDLSVSRQHAVVHLMEDQAIIKDMDSRHGTFVNGRPVKSCALSDGDIIRIGKTTLSFVQKEFDQDERPHSEITEVSVPDELEPPADQSSLQEAATPTPTDSASLIDSTQVNQYQIQEIARREDLEMKPDRIQCYLSVHLDLKDKLNSLLKGAENSVYFLMHMLDDRDTVRTLSRIKNEGIAVKGVLSFQQLDQLPQMLLDLIDDQLDVRVTAPTDPILFHNTMIIDQQIVVSCPMYQSRRTDAPLDANLLVVEDKSVAQVFLSEFNRLWYNISKRHERSPHERSASPDEKTPLVASRETEAEHFVEELTQTPENFKRLLTKLLRQDRKDKAVELINA